MRLTPIGVKCPACGSEPGTKCITFDSYRRRHEPDYAPSYTSYHMARRDSASEWNVREYRKEKYS